MKQAKGTHRKMGRKGGESAGLESGVAEVKSYKAAQGVEINSTTQRPKPKSHGSIAVN